MPSHVLRYAITNRSRYGSNEADREAGILLQTQHLAQTGIDFIQLREKDLAGKDLLRLARSMIDLLQTTGSRTRLLINSSLDVAAAAGAHGVHLTSGEEELTPTQSRQVLRNASCIISVACHTLSDVQRARNNGAELILFGPVFGKSAGGTIVVSGTGLGSLAEACRSAGPTPVLALGGVTSENASRCLDAGAGGIAGIRLFDGPGR